MTDFNEISSRTSTLGTTSLVQHKKYKSESSARFSASSRQKSNWSESIELRHSQKKCKREVNLGEDNLNKTKRTLVHEREQLTLLLLCFEYKF